MREMEAILIHYNTTRSTVLRWSIVCYSWLNTGHQKECVQTSYADVPLSHNRLYDGYDYVGVVSNAKRKKGELIKPPVAQPYEVSA